jgi:hypothetical protein
MLLAVYDPSSLGCLLKDQWARMLSLLSTLASIRHLGLRFMGPLLVVPMMLRTGQYISGALTTYTYITLSTPSFRPSPLLAYPHYPAD